MESTRNGTLRDVAKGSFFAALYMLFARFAVEWLMTWYLGDPEEGRASGRICTIFIGFVIVFHRFEGPASLGMSLALLQLALLVVYYMIGACYYWGSQEC
ncbi:hypothetical protein DIPPA_08966 [Diplonema papillatum]|nr:hypothetical protein DIPPA_08966 [Diplonema papillatum]